ncbi:MAG TPA: coproporphyrinogen-III oxidase family protein [Vicinamibacterales bacterium]|nr:coproporphyrinogen-III oxidase family protein [Vicinamibacterales bacterium]
MHPTTAWAGPEPEVGNYFVSTYPPFSCWTPDGAEAFRRMLQQPPPAFASEGVGLYVHIPFCVERCSYCYYLAHDNRSGDVASYVDALAGELDAYRRLPALAGRPLSFVYFGGGTPSVLPLARLRTLLDALQRARPWTSAREVTFECAPKSVTLDKLRFLRDAGVTRLSLGAQQLDDRVLEANGRVHLVADVERAWDHIRQVGFPVVNIDLIVGLVQETDESFFRSLDRIIEISPESVTIYQLEIPLNTRLYGLMHDGRLSEPVAGWDTKHARLARALEALETAGYQVRSAYSAVRGPDYPPFLYQDEQYQGADVLGIGVSAFSHVGGVNLQNLATLDSYFDARRQGRLPLWRGYAMTDEERLVREFVLQLKLGGAGRRFFQRKFGVDPAAYFAEPLAEGVRRGWFQCDPDRVTVTRDGLVRIDRLLPAFYRPEHQAIRYS